MFSKTFLTALLTATALAAPNMGPPKPAKTFSLAALNTCGCDIPAFFIQECQNIPASVSKAGSATEDCVCSRQWYGMSDSCADCLNNALKKDEFPELAEFMSEFVGVTKQIYSACTLTGGSVSSDGTAVCGHTYYGASCAHIAADGKSGWVSFKGSSQAKTSDVNVTAKFELGPFEPKWAGQTLELPDSGYPKEEEKKEDEEEEKSETDKETTDKDESTSTSSSEKASSSSSSSATPSSSAAGGNGTVEALNKDSGAMGNIAGVKQIGLAAVFGLGVALFV